MMWTRLRALAGAAFILLAAFGAQAQTRAELEAKATELRAWVVQLQAEADYMIAQRVRIMEEVAKTEAQVAAVEAQIAALPPDRSDVLRYWFTSDDGDGPSRTMWSRHLRIGWANEGGDWRDAAGTKQGAAPFAQATVSKLGPLSIPLADVQAMRRGVLLRIAGKNYPYVSFAGRLSATPPTLTVTMADGTQRVLPALCLAAWNTTTINGLDTRKSARVNAGTGSVLALFDIPADAVSGTLDLTVVARNSYPGTVSVLALDPPGIMYPREHAPQLGIAATVADEEALKTHPSVLRAGDFDLRNRSVFTGVQQAPQVTQEYLPDPLAPGRVIYRSMFKQRDGTAKGDQDWRGSLSATVSLSPADTTDPMRPIKEPAPREMFARLCFKMEADWLARNDANKMALGWDLRYGYWTAGNSWQQTTGNGGARGTGLKVLRTAKPGAGQWEYQGHSIRMEAGRAPADPAHPHDALRPITSYTYHLDQFDFNGTAERWGAAVIERDRWHCIEQQLRVNSVAGPFDANGNGQAVADGLMRTWIDGVFVGERTGMRWGRHPSMGVEGPWINWFFGGKQAADREMHYQMADFVLATEYIGLPNNFHLRNAANDARYLRTGTK